MTPRLRATALLLVAGLVACESDATLPEPGEPGPTGELLLDASSSTAFTYVDLENLSTVTPATPATSTGWDVGIRRYEVRLNGGLTGPGDVAATVLVDHAGQDAATILGYTAANRLAEFEAIDADDIPASAAFSASGLVNDPSSWFTPTGQGIAANPARAWKIRRGDGGFAVLRIAEFGFTGQALTGFTVEYRLQSGSALGSLESATIVPGAPGAPTRLSLATGTATTADGCGWDLAVDAALTVTLNTGCNAGSYPLQSGEAFDALTTVDAPQYGPFLAAITSPIANSVSADDAPPFLYGLDEANPHRLVPSFNIYLVRRGTAVYKVQFLNYYNPAGGASGFPTLRVSRIK